MGILAGNAMVDSGSIIYQGQDLLKLHEDEFHKIRGNKIGMIFQDPTSSLNPIMKVGKQIAEGMIVNGKRKNDKFLNLIQKEYQEFVNAKYELNDYKSNYKYKKNKKDDLSRYKLEIKQIKANQSINNEQKNKLIQENQKIIEEIIATKPILDHKEQKKKIFETKSKLKKLKKILSKRELEAKLIINKEYQGYKEEYKKEIYIIKNKLKLDGFLSNLKFKLKKEMLPIIKFLKYTFSYKGKFADLSNAYENYLRKIKVTRLEAREESLKIMNEVGIPQPEKRINMYPFQFSGGMKQRIVIAIALTAKY